MMHIEITAQQASGCTDFVPHPERLHLGSQYAEGVDTLSFALPEEWAGKAVSLHIEQENGTLPTPLLLDGEGCVAVDRRLTAARSGRWMLTATDGAGYTAYTHPGTYDTCETIPTDGSEEPPASSTPYEQFVAQVLEGAQAAAASSREAAQSAREAAASAAQAAEAQQSAAAQAGLAASSAEESGTRAEQAAASAAEASASADRAEEAALRAETGSSAGSGGSGGAVTSVNGQVGQVQLDAADVGALPLPAQPVAGCLLQVQTVDSATGAVTTETVPASDLTDFVRRTDRPTAQEPGPVKVGAGYGLSLTQEGELRLDPAAPQLLETMDNGWSPVTPGLVPLAVKLALTALWDSAAWTDEDRAQARSTLDAAQASALEELAQRVEDLELKYNTAVTQNAFTADLSTLNNLTASGTWNAGQARIEF